MSLLCGAMFSVLVPADLVDLAVTQLTLLWNWKPMVGTLRAESTSSERKKMSG